MEHKHSAGYPVLPPLDASKPNAPPQGSFYPHPPPSYTPQPSQPMPQQQPTVVMMQHPAPVVMARPAPVGPTSSTVTCPSCHATVSSRVDVQASNKTHIIALVLCLLGCWPCVCIPYCMDSCQNANHYCPNCNAFLGSYQA